MRTTRKMTKAQLIAVTKFNTLHLTPAIPETYIFADKGGTIKKQTKNTRKKMTKAEMKTACENITMYHTTNYRRILIAMIAITVLTPLAIYIILTYFS